MHLDATTLQLGSKIFSSFLVQGPLAGYTCAPLRRQTWDYSTPGYCSTEMASSTHLVHARYQPQRFTYRDPLEGPLCFQFSANNPQALAKATQIVDALGVEIIELNCGCPVNKIRSKGAGSKLLSQPDQLRQLIAAIRKNTNAVLSVKIRVAGEHQDHDDFAVAQIAQDEGADVLVVHGRHWTEHYDTAVRYDAIKRIVDNIDIPVIGNGDVKDLVSLQKMLATGCQGVMIARACVGQPWLFDQLMHELQGKTYTAPETSEVGEIFIRHIDQLAILDSERRAILQARTMAKYYARERLENRVQFISEINQCLSMETFQTIVRKHFIS